MARAVSGPRNRSLPVILPNIGYIVKKIMYAAGNKGRKILD